MSKQPSAIALATQKLREQGRRTQTYRKEELRESSTKNHPLPSAAVHLDISVPEHGLTIAVLTDAQVKRGVDTDHLEAAGNYIADKRPDVIVCIGDFADTPSLSRHEEPGSLAFEGARYRDDVSSVKVAMDRFLKPIRNVPEYDPYMALTIGNHEDRVTRAVNANPRVLDGIISEKDFGYEDFGWEVYPFLQPVVIGGMSFCHFFPSGVMGRPITTARALLTKMHMSCFAGHQQGMDQAVGMRGDGKMIRGLISGSFYAHDEDYLSPLTNRHWRGMWFLHEVKDGEFSAMELSLSYLLRRWL